MTSARLSAARALDCRPQSRSIVGDRANQALPKSSFGVLPFRILQKFDFGKIDLSIFRIHKFSKSNKPENGSTEPRKGDGPFLGSVEPYF
jgi:hypothetical protein